MQYTVTVPIHDSLGRLLEALSSALEVPLDASVPSQAVAGEDALKVSGDGHVLVQFRATDAKTGVLQLDGNRQRIKQAKQICSAFSSAFGADPAARDVAQSNAIFQQALGEMDGA
ncbi:MAG: hypothetical protein ACI9OJ_003758 [Myxococcota bacterium]|jgi:hypothetical protein